MAQAWADTCPDGHNPDRNVDGIGLCGENMYNSDSLDLTTAVPKWFDELNNFSSDGIASYVFDSGTNRYTQLVWASSSLLGCGYVSYGTDESTHILVCNYYMSGNLGGQSVYETGTPCSNCGTDTCNTDYAALCENGIVMDDTHHFWLTEEDATKEDTEDDTEDEEETDDTDETDQDSGDVDSGDGSDGGAVENDAGLPLVSAVILILAHIMLH